MNTNDGKFLKIKKILALVTAVGVLWASIVFSKNGFNFETNSDYIWIGWLLAFAATSAEFMLASDFRKLNWSIVALGLAAYIYSIWSNVMGFQDLRGKNTTDLFSPSSSWGGKHPPRLGPHAHSGVRRRSRGSRLGCSRPNLRQGFGNTYRATAQPRICGGASTLPA